jgi:hypothetical protein
VIGGKGVEFEVHPEEPVFAKMQIDPAILDNIIY